MKLNYHARAGLLANEGVPQDLGEFAGAEREMSTFPAQRADAFLQRQQRLVDLCSFHSYKQYTQCNTEESIVSVLNSKH